MEDSDIICWKRSWMIISVPLSDFCFCNTCLCSHPWKTWEEGAHCSIPMTLLVTLIRTSQGSLSLTSRGGLAHTHSFFLGYWLFWWKCHSCYSCCSHWVTCKRHKCKPFITACGSDLPKTPYRGGLPLSFLNSLKCLPFYFTFFIFLGDSPLLQSVHSLLCP